jgi:D-alanine transaminase
MSAIGWYNGTIGPLESMTVPMNDRAVYFGDGCYEACLASSERAFALDAHIDRFYRSLSGLRIAFDVDRDALKAILFDCLRAADEPFAVLYWQVSRATAPRTHAFPEGGYRPNLLVTVTPKTPVPARTLKLVTAEDIRYAMCSVKTLNLIPNILANERAKESGADEAVFVREGFVTEGSHTNIHILKNGTLYTHPTDERILAGVTRAILLDVCRARGVPAVERAFTKEELFAADEVLISSSTLGVLRADSVDGVPVGGAAPELYRSLRKAYERIYDGEMQV